eukprot:NODE_8031_length_727_cov_96.445364_g7779_i0.p1 GENE.NODE_8031_length_727_cov_96.445364_g7779_i0~~NODE_8031_length_727_cov_96.445364_g7779_i0.p1  ORF type:complete len:209 (+),score=55.41 NODE_8031_length_727_cov_96.445364_g7779_i0:76-627(+)
MAQNRFLLRNPEKSDLNQYWYSIPTIEAIVNEIEAIGAKRVAFISTPSLYFSLKNDTTKQNSKVLDFDRKWEKDPGFVFYDFNKPLEVPPELHHAFDLVVVDPPFITEEVWAKYTETANLLLCPDGKALCSTIAENAAMMEKLMNVKPVAFKPSIPHLVYQYLLYASFDPIVLAAPNPEIPDD